MIRRKLQRTPLWLVRCSRYFSLKAFFNFELKGPYIKRYIPRYKGARWNLQENIGKWAKNPHSDVDKAVSVLMRELRFPVTSDPAKQRPVIHDFADAPEGKPELIALRERALYMNLAEMQVLSARYSMSREELHDAIFNMPSKFANTCGPLEEQTRK